MISKRTWLNFKLRDHIKSVVVHYRDEVKNLFPDCEVYLFGSISTGHVTDNSDVDLLIIFPGSELTPIEKKDKKF